MKKIAFSSNALPMTTIKANVLQRHLFLLKSCLLLFIFTIGTTTVNAQDWNWHGKAANPTIKEYITGTIQKMESERSCTNYAYGKRRYQKIDVYSYSTDGLRIRFQFRFRWQIDYVLMPSQQFSFTLGVSCMPDGCNTKIDYEDETGGSDCNCSIGYKYDLGCLYGR